MSCARLMPMPTSGRSIPRPPGRRRACCWCFTGEDVKKADFGDVPCLVPLENRDGTPRGETPRPMLAQGRVRHVGDPVALVVAETLEQAKDAAELIEVDYAARPHVVGTYEAAQPGAPLVHDHIKDNIVFDWEMGDRASDRGGLRQGRPRGQAADRQPAAGRELDGAARRHLRATTPRTTARPCGSPRKASA